MSAGYTPAFGTMLTGSLYGRWPHTGVWACLLSRVSRDGTIDEHPSALAAAIGIPVDDLRRCIEDFMQPDPESRSQECEGRKLVLIDATRAWGWRVVNFSKYREKARKRAYDEERTASGADADRKRRERDSSRDVPTPPDATRSHSHSHTQSHSQSEDARAPDRPDVSREDVARGTVDHGTALAGMASAEDVLAEMRESWKRDVDGVNVEALQRFFDFAANEVNPPSKRKDFSPSARISLAKKLAGMGDAELQAAVVEQSISSDHCTLYALKDRPAKHAQESARRRQDEQREMLALKSRAIIAGCRAPRTGEDLGDYRVIVERAEVAAKDKAHRESLAKRGPKSAAELLGGAQ